ncbi:MAG: hypothetical protein R3E13_11110 [Alphaproteobacteria bacterium]
MSALKRKDRDIFQGKFDLRITGRGQVVLPEDWEQAIGDRKLIAMPHQKSGKMLFSLEEFMDWRYISEKLQQMNEYTRWKDRRNFESFSSPSIYLQDVCKRKTGRRIILSRCESSGSKTFTAAAQGRGPYFLMQAFDDRWKLDKPSPLNHVAAYVFVTCVDPKARPSDPGQNLKDPEPGGV